MIGPLLWMLALYDIIRKMQATPMYNSSSTLRCMPFLPKKSTVLMSFGLLMPCQWLTRCYWRSIAALRKMLNTVLTSSEGNAQQGSLPLSWYFTCSEISETMKDSTLLKVSLIGWQNHRCDFPKFWTCQKFFISVDGVEKFNPCNVLTAVEILD
jgi:hypothetical protein